MDSHYFLQELRREYPNESLQGFFYDPNIHPFSEHELRFLDVARSCAKLNITLHKGEYDYRAWLDGMRGFESEPERGARCQLCFDFRMAKSVEMALALGERKLTTTLLTSPKKDLKQLEIAMSKQCQPFGIEFFAPDFRKGGGTQRQFELAKKDKLYHQHYCGCIYGLEQQKRTDFIDEFCCEFRARIMPGSIEERIEFFKEVMELEDKGIEFDFIKQKFLNYRLLFAHIKHGKKTMKAHILFYSHFKNKMNRFSVRDLYSEDIYVSMKDDIAFLSFNYVNNFYENRFKSFDDFCKNPPKISEENALRSSIFEGYNLSPIIVIESLVEGVFEIKARSEIYSDSKNKIRLIK